jgi:hypothetical protein
MSVDNGRTKLKPRTVLGSSMMVGLPLFFACSAVEDEPTAAVQQPVHLLDIFELDGDADDDAAAGVDWENALTGTNLVASTDQPIADPGDVSIFTGGGSKDVEDVSKWLWTDGSVPDKDNITNAYAVAYTDANEDLVAYFGADRFSTEGDAQIGFWFFKNKISLVNPTRPSGSGSFDGVHAVGDILVLSDFTQGGTDFTIQILEWAQTGTKGGKPVFGLVTLASGVSATTGNPNLFCLKDTNSAAPDYTDDACATVNHTAIAPFWAYQPKFPADNDPNTAELIPINGFYEGGINLSDIVPGNTCFSSFLAETRSSQSPTATLKDFVLGDFETCSISVVKDCNDTVLNAQGSEFLYTSTWTATVSNSGAGDLPDGTVISVQDDNGTPNDDSDDPDPQTCTIGTDAGEAATPEDCVFGGTIQTNTNGVTNTVTATAIINGTTLTATGSDTCPVAPLNPSLQICKYCNTALSVVEGQVVVGVNFAGEVCNNGDIPLQMTVTDNHLVDPVSLSNTDADGYLAPETCGTYSGSYFPDSSSADPLAALYEDTVTAVGDHSAIPQPVEVSSDASCGLCAVEPACDANPSGEGGAGGTSG